MHISCPHCTTSYAIDVATLGAAGRTVRCSRCKEVWLARPEHAIAAAASASPAMAAGAGRQAAREQDAAAEWEALARQDEHHDPDPPVVDSPSISADWPAADHDRAGPEAEPDRSGIARDTAAIEPRRPSRVAGLFKRRTPRPALPRLPGRSLLGLPTACAAMGALAVALLIWRVDVVRLVPQTSAFYKLIGLEVNPRGLLIKDVKVSNEAVDGKPVLVIEGVIIGETRKAVELPRLRFSIRDAQGAEIYVWNAVLDQPVLKPGEHAWFKSRLASPPPEGRNIDVRFLTNRDIVGGHA